jgi:hypothetical protein
MAATSRWRKLFQPQIREQLDPSPVPAYNA